MPYDPEFKPPQFSPQEQNPVIYAARFRFKYKDIFDLKGFYEMLHEWLNSRDWKDREKKDHYEDYYLEKIDPGDFREIHIWWRPEKVSESTKFYKWKMRIDYKILAMKSTEIMYQGHKLKVDKGEIEMKIWSFLELVGYKEWNKNPFLKNMFQIFIRRIIEPDLMKQKLLLYRETYEMQNAMKNYLQMKLFLPTVFGEQFHESGSYPSWKK
jgi:hypothetical protein